MKHIILILAALALVACAGFAQHQILYRDQFTIAYDPPNPPPELLAGESAVYRVWLWDMAQGPPVVTSTTGWTFHAETATLSQFIVTPADPRREYAVGVQLVLIRADGTEQESDFAVTTNPDDIDPNGVPGVPFVYAPDSGTLQKVRNLRDSGT